MLKVFDIFFLPRVRAVLLTESLRDERRPILVPEVELSAILTAVELVVKSSAPMVELRLADDGRLRRVPFAVGIFLISLDSSGSCISQKLYTQDSVYRRLTQNGGVIELGRRQVHNACATNEKPLTLSVYGHIR